MVAGPLDLTLANTIDKIYSTSVPTQLGQVVLNPDGSSIGSSVTLAATKTDDAAFTVGTSLVLPVGFLCDETGTDSVDEGDVGASRMTANRVVLITGQAAHDGAAIDTTNNRPLIFGGVQQDPTSLPSAGTVGRPSYIATSRQQEVLIYNSRLQAGEDQNNNLMGWLPKPIAGNTYTFTPTQNNSFQTTNIKASAGNLLKVFVINTTGAARYLQVHNTATTPGGGATAAFKWLVLANSSLNLGPKDLGDAGLYFSSGIAIANSTTASTYTAGVAGDLLVDIITI